MTCRATSSVERNSWRSPRCSAVIAGVLGDRLAQTWVARANLAHQPAGVVGAHGTARHPIACACPAPGGCARAMEQASDPNKLGYSLANVAEILFGCLDAAGARAVLEIGAYRGELTAELLDWAGRAEPRSRRSSPSRPPSCSSSPRRSPSWSCSRETSHEALAALPDCRDAIIIDGDHNYYTLSEELRLIGERAAGRRAAAAAVPRRRLAARPPRHLLRARSGYPRSSASRWSTTPVSLPGSPGSRPTACPTSGPPRAREAPATAC